MPLSTEIIPSYRINKTKWDACIYNSDNALIYAYSWYLDHLADNWNGIIIDDYRAVMPLVWRKKYGIKYCYIAPFIQQLGWFIQREVSDKSIFDKSLFSFCRYADYPLNFKNRTTITNTTLCSNYVLDLSREYESIKEEYNTDLKTNLKKASKETFIYAAHDIDTAIDLYKELYSRKFPNVSNTHFENFRLLSKHLSQNDYAVVRSVTNAKNELLAITLLLRDEKRLYNIMNSSSIKGRKTAANHFLFDNIFKEFAGSKLLFDFEGSDIPGIKNFYEKFGAINQPYQRLHFNRLPFPINILKR